MVTHSAETLNQSLNRLLRNFSVGAETLNSRLDLGEDIQRGIDVIYHSSKYVRDRYYDQKDILSGAAWNHSDLFANLLLRVSHSLLERGLEEESIEVAKLNKYLHGLDFFPNKGLPEVLKLVHPVGSVIGRTAIPSFSAIYQGVSVGSKLPNNEIDDYPVFEGPVILFARSGVFGSSRIGPNVVFAADSMVMDFDVPADSIVLGRYPNNRVVQGSKRVFEHFFSMF